MLLLKIETDLACKDMDLIPVDVARAAIIISKA